MLFITAIKTKQKTIFIKKSGSGGKIGIYNFGEN